jgi:hypothetical protein
MMNLGQQDSLVMDVKEHGVGQKDILEPFKKVWLYDRVRGGVPTARCARSRRIGRRVRCASWEMSHG